MPPRSDEQRLRDILAAIEKIRRYTVGMDAEVFAADEKTLEAVIRNFTVIGEAASHLSNELFGVAILRETVQHDLPELERELRGLLPP